jgi:hypothetical protein
MAQFLLYGVYACLSVGAFCLLAWIASIIFHVKESTKLQKQQVFLLTKLAEKAGYDKRELEKLME